MNDLEDGILNHIGLYQISFPAVIEQRFLDGRPCGQMMNRLAAERHIRIRKGFPGRTPKYFQLTRAELKRRGLPEWRSRRPKSQAFPTSVAILWFCNRQEVERHLLNSSETTSLIPSGLPAGTHCIERVDGEHRLCRIRVTNSLADPDHGCLLRCIRKRVSQAVTFPGLRPWVESRRYSFAVLTDSDEHAQSIRNAIGNDDLLALANIIVEPTPAFLRLVSTADHSRTR